MTKRTGGKYGQCLFTQGAKTDSFYLLAMISWISYGLAVVTKVKCSAKEWWSSGVLSSGTRNLEVSVKLELIEALKSILF